MSSLPPVGRSAATPDKDRKSLCRFTPAPACRSSSLPTSLRHHPAANATPIPGHQPL
jgi:hypothetical protein